jgi:hypothetical protein
MAVLFADLSEPRRPHQLLCLVARVVTRINWIELVEDDQESFAPRKVPKHLIEIAL